MTASGQPDGTFTQVIDGTTNCTVFNLAGHTVVSVTMDVLSGAVLSQSTFSSFDAFGRPGRVTYLDGTYEDTSYACCGIGSTVDRDGVATQYWYDAAKRPTAQTRLNITTTNVLDGAGRVLKTIRIGSDGSPIVQGQWQYNAAGELLKETNALNGVTT